jgi:hypothetical protein
MSRNYYLFIYFVLVSQEIPSQNNCFTGSLEPTSQGNQKYTQEELPRGQKPAERLEALDNCHEAIR